MRRTLLTSLVSVSLLLAACGGESAADVACQSVYWDGTLGTCLPADWQVIDRGGLDERGTPPEVLVAFQSEKPVAGQFPTVTVIRETLTQQLDSKAYSDASVRSVESLPGYEHIEAQDVTIDDATVSLHIFAAQPKPEEPKKRYFQVSFAGNGAGYTVTGATPLTVPDVIAAQVKLVLQNATLREPAAE